MSAEATAPLRQNDDLSPGAPAAPPVPFDEPQRLAALARYGILDTPPDPGFDRLAGLAARLFDVPIALVSLVDRDRLFLKSRHGLEVCETPRSVGFCAHTILSDDALVVPDLAQDPRFAANPLVAGEAGFRFYAGAPLVTSDGFRLGALCLIDTAPRPPLTGAERATLADLAALAVDQLERHRAWHEARRARARDYDHVAANLVGLFATCPLAVVTTLPDGRVTGWNPAAEAMFGWSRDEVRGGIAPFLPGGADGCEAGDRGARRASILGGERVSGLELRATRRDGSPIDIRVAAAPLLDSGGDAVGILAIVEDVTGQKRREAELVQAKEQAELGNRAKSEFLANMSHELRTPLNAIIGFTELMQQEIFGPLGAREYGEYLRDVHDSGCHLLQIINSILDLARIEAGTAMLDIEPVDVGRVARASLRLVEARASAAGLALEVAVADGLPAVAGDEARIRQMLLNLLSNAVKFTPRGGRIAVRADREAGGGLALSVGDTGTGIAGGADGIARVLAPFGQAANAMTRGHDGIGLGLPVTKRLIELHGGTFALDSAPGRGTVATLRFPPDRIVPAS